jgi:hypothetical protein
VAVHSELSITRTECSRLLLLLLCPSTHVPNDIRNVALCQCPHYCWPTIMTCSTCVLGCPTHLDQNHTNHRTALFGMSEAMFRGNAQSPCVDESSVRQQGEQVSLTERKDVIQAETGTGQSGHCEDNHRCRGGNGCLHAHREASHGATACSHLVFEYLPQCRRRSMSYRIRQSAS